jgi:pilus assembly protein Flp/PilA
MNSVPPRKPKRQEHLLTIEEKLMTDLLLRQITRLHEDQSGQGLVEYLLVLALVAFAATAGMHTVATTINSAFNTIGAVLGQYIT